ncbi:CYTH and CHAD domain-containing protein [Arthrobacter sp. UYEF20]|uniref:CYTH and CHAD domain-containing protein n=1 Tax=Arthrobacter sp. UYEF20 TaxID=1756363 RepID=UPI0033931EBC
MEPTGNLESEQKYDAETSTPLPALLEVPGVERVSEPVTDHLEAVYFDTPALALASRRITLRRRTGGTDDGWHLKFPAGPDQRRELHAPLGQPETVPEELADHLHVYTRGEHVIPVARLSSQRTTYWLYGPGGEHLADFADDRVQAQALHPPGPGMACREWEFELVHGAPRLFTAAEATLTATGAGRSRHTSKLARALGDAWPPEHVPRNRGPRKKAPRKKGPATDVVTAYLGEQITELLTHDPGVRLGRPDAVHQMRSATRRSRSALATYRRLFRKTSVRRLRDELKWLASILGPPRDAEVMRERLRQHVRELPKGLGHGPIREPIEHELGTAYNAGYKRVLKTLETGRYYRLLEDLEDFRDYPPATARASRPARKTTTKLVNKDAQRLDRAHQTAADSGDGTSHDTALQQVRKDAKRLRHAAESVTAIHGKRARTLAKAAKRLEKVLGHHQDSVKARAFLSHLAAAPDLPGRTALAYRRIEGVEERLAQAAEAKYLKIRKKAYGIRLD